MHAKTMEHGKRHIPIYLLALLACLAIASLAGCDRLGVPAPDKQPREQSAAVSHSEAPTTDEAASAATDDADTPSAGPGIETGAGLVQLDKLPAFSGELSVAVNGGVPFFTEDDRARSPFEDYSPLDDLGRAGAAFALISRDTMPTEERTDGLSYNPSGWQVDTYDWVDHHFLYNRCHLIAWSLAGEGDNKYNLITGTRTLNMEGMRPFEEQVSSYVYRTNNSVLYRVTPIYGAENLVASGVLMEAQSLEDAGASLEFCAYCYNVEPGVAINYATGENQADGTMQAKSYEPSTEEQQADFVINKSSRVYHYPDCDSVSDMREHNKLFFQGTLEELQEQYRPEDGYRLCKKCRERHPEAG